MNIIKIVNEKEEYLKVYYFPYKKERGICLGYMDIDATSIDTVERTLNANFDGANLEVKRYKRMTDAIQIFAEEV